MSASEQAKIEEIVKIFFEARKKLGSSGSFRSRVLIDMVLLELGKVLASLSVD